MARTLWFNVFLLGAALLLICLPFYRAGMPLWIGVSLMAFGAVCEAIRNRPTFFSGGIILVLLIYWILQAIGSLYSPVPGEGWTKTFVKVSLVLLPASAFLFAQRLNRSHILFGLNLFHLACVISAIFHIISGYLLAQETSRSMVYYEEFSRLMHPAYISLMLCCAVIIGLYMKTGDHWGRKILGTYYKPITTVLFLSTIFLLSSRIQMIAIFIVLLTLAIARLFSAKTPLRAKVISVVLVILALSIGTLVIRSNARLARTITELSHPELSPGSTLTSTSVRILAWQIGVSELMDAPLVGQGTASCKNQIATSELGKKHPLLATGRLGMHNQYLSEAVDHGFPGLILILLVMMLPVMAAIRSQNAMLLGVTSLIAISLLTESMFEREAGVFIFGLLIPLAWLHKRRVGFA